MMPLTYVTEAGSGFAQWAPWAETGWCRSASISPCG